jgi:predicted transposase/invertase (TIGR01784 family)
MNDFVFKMVFGDEHNTDILADFLKAVLPLPEEEFASLKIGNTFLNRDAETHKMSILDVKVQTASGKRIDVEIQVARTRGVRKRIVYYSARMLRDQMRKGDKYEDLQQVVCILITGFELLPEEKDYFSEISLCHIKSGKEFTDVLKYIILELPKLPKTDDARQVWDWSNFEFLYVAQVLLCKTCEK